MYITCYVDCHNASSLGNISTWPSHKATICAIVHNLFIETVIIKINIQIYGCFNHFYSKYNYMDILIIITYICTG